MDKRRLVLIVSLLLCVALFGLSCANKKGDIVLKNGKVYTMEEDQPWANTVVISGNKIAAVLDNPEDAESYIGPETSVIDLEGKFVVPGFIDAHTHFNEFAELICDVDLMPVSEDEGLKEELRRVLQFVDDGEWITGGKWDGHRLWNVDWRLRDQLKKNRWKPDRWTIDPITPNNPCFLWSWDKELYLANTAALKAAGLENAKLSGMVLRRGKPTGLIRTGSPALDKLEEVMHPKTDSRILKGMRAGFQQLASEGIVEIHDITVEKYPERYAKLQDEGSLTCRVWMRPDLSRSAEFRDKGLKMKTHPVTGKRDHYLRYGAFKGYLDGLMGSHGALLSEPYADRPDTYGHFRPHSSDDPNGYKIPNLDKMYNMMKIGLEAGYIIDTHAIGDSAATLLLDMYGKLAEELGTEKIARSRVIHAQTIREKDFAKFAPNSIIAEGTPSNVPDDLRWIRRRLGQERERLSHPFRQFFKRGIVFLMGSDIPGAQGATFPSHPRTMIHAAVNRQTFDHKPAGGWLPEHKISVHEALKAYTINAAYAVFDEDVRGSIKKDKLADLAVCDRNLIEIDPADILNMEIEMTIVNGKIVFEREK